QERWSTAVGLDADGVETRFGMREFLVPVGSHSATAVDVRVDERSPRFGGLERQVQPDAKLARDAQVGSLACRADDFVDFRNFHRPIFCIHSDGDELVASAAYLTDG